MSSTVRRAPRRVSTTRPTALSVKPRLNTTLSGLWPGTLRAGDAFSKSLRCCHLSGWDCPTVFFRQEKSIICPVPWSTAPDRVPRWKAVSEKRRSISWSSGLLRS